MKMFLLVDAFVYAMKEVLVILGFSWILDKDLIFLAAVKIV